MDKTFEEKIEEIIRLIRSDYTMGGSFSFGSHRSYSGLCFTYEQLENKEKELEKLVRQICQSFLSEILPEGKEVITDLSVYDKKAFEQLKNMGFNSCLKEIKSRASEIIKK